MRNCVLGRGFLIWRCILAKLGRFPGPWGPAGQPPNRSQPSLCFNADLTYRRVDPDAFRIPFDGVEVGSVAKRHHHVRQLERWHWSVGILLLADHGGRAPEGTADAFTHALAAFKAASTAWHVALPR